MKYYTDSDVFQFVYQKRTPILGELENIQEIYNSYNSCIVENSLESFSKDEPNVIDKHEKEHPEALSIVDCIAWKSE